MKPLPVSTMSCRRFGGSAERRRGGGGGGASAAGEKRRGPEPLKASQDLGARRGSSSPALRGPLRALAARLLRSLRRAVLLLSSPNNRNEAVFCSAEVRPRPPPRYLGRQWGGGAVPERLGLGWGQEHQQQKAHLLRPALPALGLERSRPCEAGAASRRGEPPPFPALDCRSSSRP